MKNKVQKPVVILIGGYAGTGKSTLAKSLSQKNNDIVVLPTGIIRAILQLQSNGTESELLKTPSYNLATLASKSKRDDAYSLFHKQAQLVSEAIKSTINFMAVERQSIIIEGNHILPDMYYEQPECLVITIFLTVNDSTKHQKMLGGITHDRVFTKKQLATAEFLKHEIDKVIVNEHRQFFDETQHDAAAEYVQDIITRSIGV